MAGDKYRCPVCLRDVAPTAAGKFRKHGSPECDMSAVIIPQHVLNAGPSSGTDEPVMGRDYAECPACGRTPRLGADGAYAPHRIIPSGSEACPMGGKPYRPAGAAEEDEESCQSTSQELTTTAQQSSAPGSATPPGRDLPTTAPTPSDTTSAPPISADVPDQSTQEPTQSLGVGSAATRERPSSVLSRETGIARADAPATASAHASTEQPWTSADFRQPDPPFWQPDRTARVLAQATPMTERGIEIAARLKEIFFAYSNRLARNTQKALGPSEIGTPCDRRIAMSLLRVPPTNPGGDNWASFVGTCVHSGLAEMFVWADADTGRYAVEMPLSFPSAHVPRGTGDLLDRTALMFLDHKCMGRWSLDRLSTKGPTPVYRVQVHTYAYGARLKGERVDYVAIVGWPREASSLDDLYVWTEPYDASIAIKALERVERISQAVKRYEGEPLQVARKFPTADDCRFCPFHAPGDQAGERGCNGKT